MTRHAVISGGSSGIGLAIARQLVQSGCSVSLLARRREPLNRACVPAMRARGSGHLSLLSSGAGLAIRGMHQGRFSATPGLEMTPLGWLHAPLAPPAAPPVRPQGRCRRARAMNPERRSRQAHAAA